MILILPAAVLLISVFTVVIHECGHLFGGYAGGYRFVSITLPGVTVFKKNNRLIIHLKFSAEGQCIMYPGGKTRAGRLVLGGPIGSIISGLAASIITILIYNSESVVRTCIMQAFSCANLFAGTYSLLPNKSHTSDGDTYAEIRKGRTYDTMYNSCMCIYRMLTEEMAFGDICFDEYMGKDKPDSSLFGELSLYRYYHLCDKAVEMTAKKVHTGEYPDIKVYSNNKSFIYHNDLSLLSNKLRGLLDEPVYAQEKSGTVGETAIELLIINLLCMDNLDKDALGRLLCNSSRSLKQYCRANNSNPRVYILGALIRLRDVYISGEDRVTEEVYRVRGKLEKRINTEVYSGAWRSAAVLWELAAAIYQGNGVRQN